MSVKTILAGLVGAGLVFGVSPALAGEWRLDPRRCPDLVEDRWDRREDRRDARSDYGRRDLREDRWDRRENRRDERVTVCPRSAFYYAPDRWEHARYDDGRRGDRRWNARSRTPRLTLSYDRRMRMAYRVIDGRRIYVRG